MTFSGICRGSEERRSDRGADARTLSRHGGGRDHAACGEAMSRWPLNGLTVIHRFGRIEPGENIVLVLTASSHRQAAFQAAEFLMDYLKTNAPFWKREEGAQRTRAGSRRAITTTRRPRAGPNPDGESASRRSAKKRGRASKIPQTRKRRTVDAARFRPLCGEPLRRSQA